jgi:hypothetical protein
MSSVRTRTQTRTHTHTLWKCLTQGATATQGAQGHLSQGVRTVEGRDNRGPICLESIHGSLVCDAALDPPASPERCIYVLYGVGTTVEETAQL